MSEPFDVEAFYAALDRRRRERRLTWRAVCAEAGMAASLLTRMALDGKSPSVSSLCKLLLWLGETDLKPYLTAEVPTTEGDANGAP